MGISDLRKEYLKLQKEFLGGPVMKLKAHEVEHRMAALKVAMAAKSDIPEPAPKRIGPPKAREVKTTKVTIDEETEVTKPVAPKEGAVHARTYKKAAAKAAPAPEPAPVPAAAEKPKKARRVPPKVVLDESAESPAPKAPKKAATPSLAVEEKPAKPKKSKATAEPKTDLAPEPEAPAPASVVEKPAKLPGGCRRMPDAEVYLH